MISNKKEPRDGSRMFPTIAAASTVALAGQISPTMAWVTYVAILVYAAVIDWRNNRK